MNKIRLIALVLELGLCLSLAGCGKQEQDSGSVPVFEADSTEPTAQDAGELVILYTNDVHNAYQRDDGQGRMGYAAVAEYRDALAAEGKTVVLIDGGDSIQGETVGDLSNGSYLVDIMNETGYEIAVPGNHEFDFGLDTFLDIANHQAAFPYVACNFVDLRTGETVLDAYKIVDYDGVKIAYVGICTPETITKSPSADFRDGDGNDIYGFAQGGDGQELYDCVQQAIDNAKAEGADYVICIGHLGTDPGSTPWTSYEVISNTTGMIAFLDGHSHSVIEGETVADKDGKDVVLCSAGTKLTYIGEIHVDLNTGAVTASLVTGLTEEDNEVLDLTDSIASQVEEQLEAAEATADTDPTDNDSEAG